MFCLINKSQYGLIILGKIIKFNYLNRKNSKFSQNKHFSTNLLSIIMLKIF